MPERIQLWSCGGGRQSAGIAALILQGRLPRPDHVAMVDTNREKGTTWQYVNAYIRPSIESIGIPFALIDRSKYATKDIWGGADDDSCLLPVYSDQSGKTSKLPEYCSGEWKRDTTVRWAAEQGWKEQGVDSWLGISHNEKHRRRGPRLQWFQPVYPLLDWLPMDVSGCLAAVAKQGWPEPPRSSCWMCPNQSNEEWRLLRDGSPEEFEKACKIEEEIHQIDPHAFLHRSVVPLRQADLGEPDEPGLFGGCSSGMCY